MITGPKRAAGSPGISGAAESSPEPLPGSSEPGAHLDTLALVMVVILVLVVISAAVVMAVAHVESPLLLSILSGPLVTGLIGVLLSRRVRELHRGVEYAETVTEGVISAQVRSIHRRLTHQDEVLELLAQEPLDGRSRHPQEH